MTTRFEEPNLQAFIEKIAKDEGFTIPRFDITSATKPGENFISRVFRVLITDEKNVGKSLSVILKASTTSRARQEKISSDKLFRIETEMYGIVLPALNNLLAKHGLSQVGSLFPGTARCYGWDLNDGSKENEAEIVAVEDKKVDDFSTVNIGVGFDDNHCRLVLEKLALLHASFMALRILEPQKAECFEKLIYKRLWINDPNHQAGEDVKNALMAGFKMLEEPYVPGNPTYEKLLEMMNDFPNAMVKMNAVPEDVAVIAHGDCWCNNILFKNDENGKAEEVCLIDFQLSRLCSPVVDLMYVLILCTSKETRDKHYDSLIRYYFDNVHKILRALNCDPERIFTWDTLQKHLKTYGHLGVSSCLTGLPFFMAEWTADIHSLDDNNELLPNIIKRDPENTRRITKRINDAVTDSVRWGYI